jgi:ATP-dependent DNA ligase
MLALQIKNKSEEEQKDIWNNQNRWLAEEKIDGSRQVLCWFKEDRCIDAYSRNTSVTDFLPINYGQKLYDNIDISLLNDFPNFILDGELVLKNKEIVKDDTVDIIADTQLNMVSAILSADYNLSKQFQSLNPIKLIAFDILMYDDKDLTSLPLRERKKYLQVVFDRLKNIIDIELVSNSNGLSTRDFYNQVVSVGGEGLVVKDLDSAYDTKGKRAGEWVKIKRSVTGSLLEQKYGDTFDCFVIGFNEGQKGTKNEGLVASLNFGIYLLDENNNVILDEHGIPLIHYVATVGGLTDELKLAITTRDFNNDVQLRHDVYGRVCAIDGQDLSDKNLRLAHARIIQWRNDKSAQQCTIRKDFLERLVL